VVTFGTKIQSFAKPFEPPSPLVVNVELRKQKEGPWVNIDPMRGRGEGRMTEIAPKAPGFKGLLQKIDRQLEVV